MKKQKLKGTMGISLILLIMISCTFAVLVMKKLATKHEFFVNKSNKKIEKLGLMMLKNNIQELLRSNFSLKFPDIRAKIIDHILKEYNQLNINLFNFSNENNIIVIKYKNQIICEHVQKSDF